ncbi:hypothetical protein FOA52_010497 [Chlamydomonas sp. UWO 241]|nr:hypothetical protein FOA52_010497 [Chlamydomonas sp. UWO 241]
MAATMFVTPTDPADDAEMLLEANGHAEEGKTKAEESMKLYFVRMPKPPMDDTLLKRLQTEFQGHITDIKAINTRLAAKRDVVRGLRNQMSEARSLKGQSQPEFEEKLNRLKQLRDLRNGYQTKISEIKTKVKGLDFRSEAELDARIVEMEEKIRFGTIPLREEKSVVQEISKLRGMREKIKGFEGEKSSLAEMESESSKIKAMLEEMDGEFSIIKGERDSASKVVNDFWTLLKAAEKESEKVQGEQEACVERKNEALQALEAARKEIDGTMSEYRDNRKFSLQVRDLVAVGSAAEAQELCDKQVVEMLSRLSGDTAFRSEYQQMWAEQRRFPVSDLLPESCTSSEPAASAGAKGARGAAPKGAAAADKPKPVARGAEKAKDLIASIMAQASAAAAAVKAGMPPPEHDDVADVAEAEAAAADAITTKPIAITRVLLDTPAQLVQSGFGAKAAEVFGTKIEVPKVDATPFKLPVTAAAGVGHDRSKDQVRAEQMAKAAEAEDRKRKAAEAKTFKAARAVEAAKKAKEDEVIAVKEREAAAEAAVAAKAAAKRAREANAAAAKVEAEGMRQAQSRAQDVARRPVPAARRPTNTKDVLLTKVKKVWEQHQTPIAVAVVVVVLMILVLMAST